MNQKSVAWLAAVGVFGAHGVIQWSAWSYHPGNAAVSTSGLWATLWSIASLPVFGVLPESVMTLHFEILLLLNSLIWAIVAGVLVRLATSK